MVFDERLDLPAALIGHNGGPPLDEDEPDPGGWRLWCWRRAKKRAWRAPREVALRRLARAEELGVTYREYTLEILERGRHMERRPPPTDAKADVAEADDENAGPQPR